MPKAHQTITAMVDRWNDLFEASAMFASRLGGEDDPEYQAISAEMMTLENRIVATPATTRADIAAKQRFIRKTGFITPDRHCDSGDLGELVAMILRIDGERIAAR